jgi:hypothetical protein
VTNDPSAVCHSYDEAWAASHDERLAILRSIWAQDGVYLDPDVPDGVRGPEGVAEFMDGYFRQYPGSTLVATTKPNVVGDRAWYGWKATLASGESFTGAEFVEFDADGRIARATTFYD